MNQQRQCALVQLGCADLARHTVAHERGQLLGRHFPVVAEDGEKGHQLGCADLAREATDRCRATRPR